jgi:hypothetical protein
MERGKCMFNHRNLFNFSGVATSRAFGSQFVQRLSKNWQLSALLNWSSGNPLNINDGGLDISGTGQGNDRPNQVLANPYPTRKTPLEWFNPAAFAQQADGTFGNVGRNSLVGPSSFNLDAALSRTFQIKERFGLTFRADAFNLLNHPIWQDPDTDITSAQFGQITSYGAPRIMQLALKLTF